VTQQMARTRLRVGSAPDIGDYVRVDYHSTPADRPGELAELEESVFAPMFKAVVDSNKGLRAWTVATPVLQTASELGYNFFTTQVFKDSASLGAGGGTTPEVFAEVHPGRNYQTMQRVRSLDTIVKVRIFHVLDTLGSPVMSTSIK
jgi:hypothetical protein